MLLLINYTYESVFQSTPDSVCLKIVEGMEHCMIHLEFHIALNSQILLTLFKNYLKKEIKKKKSNFRKCIKHEQLPKCCTCCIIYHKI